MQAGVGPPDTGPDSCRWGNTCLLVIAARGLAALHICVGRFMDPRARQRGRDVHHFKVFSEAASCLGATRFSKVPSGSLLSTWVSQTTWALD